MTVQNVKQLEMDLASARESARAAFIETITEKIANLEAIGYEYELREKGAATAKLGRPMKIKEA